MLQEQKRICVLFFYEKKEMNKKDILSIEAIKKHKELIYPMLMAVSLTIAQVFMEPQKTISPLPA